MLVNFDNENDKRLLYNTLKSLKGLQKVHIKSSYNYKGRYKYYFAHVIPVLEENGCFIDENGEILDKLQIHEVLKDLYNPKFVRTRKGKIIVSGDSTTHLTDKDFIGEYESQIIARFSQEPFYCNFIDRETWTNEKITEHKLREEKYNY